MSMRRRRLRWATCATLFALALSSVRGAPRATAQAELVLKIATTQPSRSPLAEQLSAFARYVAAGSAGHMQVKVFAGGVLGDDPGLLDRVRDGRVQAYAGRLEEFAPVVPAAPVLASPYLFRSHKQADAALDGPSRRSLAEQLLARDLLFAMWGPSDFRVWYTRQKPLLKPADAAGLSTPAPRSGADAALLAALGMKPTSAALPAALAPGAQAPDAFDATMLEAAVASYDRAAQHVTLSRHALDATLVVYSARWFAGLPEDLQQLLRDAPEDLVKDARARQRDAATAMLARLARLGITVHEHGRSERNAFARATRGAVDRLGRELGPDARALLRVPR